MKKINNIKNHWGLLAKYLAGEADEKEKAALESWIVESEENRREFQKSRQLLEKADLYFRTRRFDTIKALKSIRGKITLPGSTHSEVGQKYTPKIYLTFVKYAAVIILALALGTTGYYVISRYLPGSRIITVASAPEQHPSEVVLPDSSRVTLNSNTTLSYPRQFSGKTREVAIAGEAFFNVSHNPDKPFIITAGNARIKVLGTSFNVRAYPESQTVEVVVETGTVQVFSKASSNAKAKEVLLDPGDKATFSDKEKSIEKAKNDDPNFIAWKTHSLIFKDSPLPYVFKTLENTYHVEIVAAGPEIEKLKYTATFKNKTIDFILDVIQTTFNLKLSGNKGRYTFESQNK